MSDADLQLYAGLIAASLVFAALMGGLFFYLAILSNILKLCQPRNRRIRPVAIYYNLIPIFNLVWIFMTIAWVTRSLRWEFKDRGVAVRGDCGKDLGIASAALWVSCLACSLLIYSMPWLGILVGIPTAICTLLHWMKMTHYHRKLLEGASYNDEIDGRYRPNWRRFDGKKRS